MIAFLATLFPITERRFAKAASLSILELYRQVHAAQPELTGRELYAEVVAIRMRIDRNAARAIVLSAEQSFAEWPKERALRFYDVVAYLVIDEFRRGHPGSHGTQTEMRHIAAKVIPADL